MECIKHHILLTLLIFIVMGPTLSQDMTFQEAKKGYKQSSNSISALKYFGCQLICNSKFCRLTRCPDAVNNKLTNKLANEVMLEGLFYHNIGQFPVKQTLADTKLKEPSHSIWKPRYITHSHREFDIIYTKLQFLKIYFSLQETINHMDTTLLKEMYVTIHTLSVLASLLSIFHIQGIKKVCALYSLKDVHKKYRWIFQYQKRIFSVLLVYPVFGNPNFDRLASFSRLAIRLPGNVTCINLASAGFKLLAEDSKVVCQECGMAVNITDFKYSPAAGKYHALGCSFVQADSDIERKNFSCSLSTSSFEALGTSMDYQVYSQFEDQRSSSMENGFSNVGGESFVQTSEVNNTADCEVRFDVKTIETDCASAMPVNAPDKEHELDQSNKLLNLQQKDQKTDDQVIRNHEFTRHGSSEDNSSPQLHASERNYNSSAVPTQSSQSASSVQQLTTKPSDISSEGSEASASPQREGHPDSESPGYASDSCHDFDDTEFFQTEFEICSQPRDVSSRETCKKNPGHYGSFPLSNFTLDYLPSNVRHRDVQRLLELISSLTVRVVVKVSDKKPTCSFGKGAEYHTGTGLAVAEPEGHYHIHIKEHAGNTSSLRQFLHLSKRQDYIYIETNKHLVPTNNVAENTIVEFFFDISNPRGIVLAKGVSVYHSCFTGDFKSILECKTSDLSLLNMIKDSWKETMSLCKSLPKSIKERMMKRVFVISHPHGGEKVFSYGEFVMVKYLLEEGHSQEGSAVRLTRIANNIQISQNRSNMRKILMYTADTCSGSTGGVVVSFRKSGSGDTEDIVLDLWMHHGVDRKHSLNASVMKVVTQEDIARHGEPSAARPAVQEEMEAEAERAANQVVSCPVFTVFAPPSHPAYAPYRKRLESYPNPFVHPHSAQDLANGGFFYGGYGDCVRCFHCGLGLRSWRPGDDIFNEHHKNRPDCQFLQMKLREAGITGLGYLPHTQTNSEESTSQDQTSQSAGNESAQNSVVENVDPKLSMQVLMTSVEQRSRSQEITTQAKIPGLSNMLVTVGNYPPQPEIVVATALQPSSQNHSLPSTPRDPTVAILEREQLYLRQVLLCKVCLIKPAKDLFLPCGELVACLDCSKLLTHCPSCGNKILATVTTYFG